MSTSLLVVCAVACRPSQDPAPPKPMPDIAVYEIAPTENAGPVITRTRSRDPLAELGATKLVSLTATNADAKTILLWLAREAGVNLVVAPDVTARASVSFSNIPASEAMRAIIAQAGLSLLTSGLERPWPPIVFFQEPVDINLASAEMIVARFGATIEMAKWIVESRPKPE